MDSNTTYPMCPICLDDIISSTNVMTTECGHKFHTNCMLQNINKSGGFSCPCCRAEMIEVEEEEEEEDDESEWEDEEDLWHNERQEIINQNNILQSYRWFQQRVNGEELEDVDEEQIYKENEEKRESEMEEVMLDENKDQIKLFVSELKKINHFDSSKEECYDELLMAFIYSNSMSYDRNRFVEPIYNKFTSILDNVEKRVIQMPLD